MVPGAANPVFFFFAFPIGVVANLGGLVGGPGGVGGEVVNCLEDLDAVEGVDVDETALVGG